MKKITLFTVLSILLAFTSCDKEEVAPKQVADAFIAKFPTATDVEWEKESDKEWEAEFKIDGKEHSSNFMQNGTWVETEYEIEETEIPEFVMGVLKSNFSEYEIDEMELSTTKDGIVYEFLIEKEDSKMEVAINPQGTITKKEVKKDGEGDNE
ncbi:PepSY-like domain-containing protein [Polaribacter sargassicola]|uniref:PepSY-like domain-containing protein n=1 Tax=Polaribacter sargassicola TaxID=2836891 RepID=UPI001F33E889|nr:PepSY-like domain-containing protein [Polaribacter sp. DS7-9]MCG1035755.1 PepSY-like domain-containing protein [Polaribacter sp. DS7-9]